MAQTPLALLDLATISPGQDVRDSFEASVALARAAERSGYRRVWYAEHHNMASIASSATSVLIGYIATHTESIRLGAGGVDAAQPLAAGDRRAVRHPGHALPRPHRPGPGPGARQRPEHDAGAAPRQRLGRGLPAGRAGAQGLPERQDPGPRGAGGAARRPRWCRSTSSARRCSAPSSPPSSACRTRSPRTSPRTLLHQAVEVYRATFQPSDAARRAVRDRRGERLRRRRRTTRRSSR